MNEEEDKRILIELLELEIKSSNERLYEKFGKEKIDEFHRLMDEAMEVAIVKQFDNFAEVSGVD